MNKVFFFFGEMGSGKSYTASRYAAKTPNAFYLEGDNYLPDYLLEKINKFEPISLDDLNDYVHHYLTPAIVEASKNNNLVCVAQAIYLNHHRKYIDSILKSYGLYVLWIYVKTPFISNLLNLMNRPNWFKWIMFFLKNKPFFQKPEDIDWVKFKNKKSSFNL
jgi:gluconate kinase